MMRYLNPQAPPLQQLRREMDRLVSNVMGYLPDGLMPPGVRARPAVNVWEEGDTVKVEAELPGIRPEQIEISVIGGELSLKVERVAVEQADVTYHRRERPVGTMTRMLRLPSDVDSQRVAADLRDGVLTISLPKAEAAKPRKINVSVSS